MAEFVLVMLWLRWSSSFQFMSGLIYQLVVNSGRYNIYIEKTYKTNYIEQGKNDKISTPKSIHRNRILIRVQAM